MREFVQNLAMGSDGIMSLPERLFWTALGTWCAYLLATSIQCWWYIMTGKVHDDED